MTARDPWDSFLDPKVVCVVGASADPKRIGGRLVRYSLEAGFRGRIIPVNPNRDSVFGIPTAPSLAALDAIPDWVIIALPSEQVPEVVEQAGLIGARNVAIVASGFAEVDAAGRAHQQRVVTVAREHGMRLLGPNSNGFMNAHAGAYFAFTPVIDSAQPVPGEVAIVTQSAAIGTYLLNRFSTIGIGVHHWLHTGNEADVTVLEVVRILAERRQVRAIGLCFEVLRDLPDLQDTLRCLAENDLVIGVLQAGLSPTGKRASEAHTAALIGAEAAVLGDLFRQAGAYTATSVASLANFIQTAVNHHRLPPRPRVGLVTTSGGVGVLMADAVESQGIAMPTLSPTLQATIRSYAPYAHPGNPVDTTAQVINEPAAFKRIIEDCAGSGELDLIAVFIAHGLAGSADPTLRQLLEVATERRRSGTSNTALAALGILTAEAGQQLQRLRVSVFTEPVDLGEAIRAYSDAVQCRAGFLARVSSELRSYIVPATVRASVQKLAADCGALTVDEIDSKDLLRWVDADVTPGGVADSATAAVEIAERLGYPVTLKLVTRALPHKAAHGALRMNLWTAPAVRTAFAGLSDLARRLEVEPFRILVERQEFGREIFVGCVRHSDLGLLAGIGPGGTDVEETGMVRWLWPPVREEDVRMALTDGRAVADVLSDAHVSALTRTANAMAAVVAGVPEIHMVEANPVMLTHDRVVIVDALVNLARPDRLDEEE